MTKTSTTQATALAASAEAPWALPRKPVDSVQSAEAHVLAHAPLPCLVRVSYTKGPSDSHIVVRANTSGGGAVVTNIYLGACADVGGTDIELINPNPVSVAGTYAQL